MTDKRQRHSPDVDEWQEQAESPDAGASTETGTGKGSPSEAPTTPVSLEERCAQLEQQVGRLREEKDRLYHQLLRRQADFDNYRKRVEREKTELRQTAQGNLIASLLPVLDNFERALALAPAGVDEEYRKGIELIYRQLYQALSAAGLEALESVGHPFDPFSHHAAERVETTEFPDQQIVEELQRGYSFKGRLLRPALVRVAVHPAPAGTEETTKDEN